MRETKDSQQITQQLTKGTHKKGSYKKRIPKKRGPYKIKKVVPKKETKIISKKKKAKIFIGDKASRDMNSHIQANILRIIKRIGPLTREELVNSLNIPRTTLYDNLEKLKRRNILEKCSKSNGRRGRPLIIWRIME